MYDELVKKIRHCATDPMHCLSCGEDKDGRCFKRLMTQAADAIEELQQIAEHYEETSKEYFKYACYYRERVPHWIPVTEQLPETHESILGKKSSKVVVAFRFDDGTQGTDTAHTLNGKWVFEDHITVVARTITHWMPLP